MINRTSDTIHKLTKEQELLLQKNGINNTHGWELVNTTTHREAGKPKETVSWFRNIYTYQTKTIISPFEKEKNNKMEDYNE